MSYPLSTLLATMNGKTVTAGWDAVVAYDRATVNALFAQQFVENVKNDSNLPPITAEINDTKTQVNVAVNGLVLTQPLISFENSTLADSKATVTMNFVAGSVLVLGQAGSVQYPISYQTIVPGDDLAMTMTVTLAQVSGQVENGKTVQVDLQDAANFKANLIGSTNAAALGTYFQDLFKTTPADLTYVLGALKYGTSVNLIPTSFDIYTQPAPSGGSGDGAVLLFVATTYNPNGGSAPDPTFPYLLPDGYSGSVVVASRTLFGNIIAPYLRTNLVGNPTLDVELMTGTSPASTVSFTGGQVGTSKPIQFTWSSGLNTYQIWSGTRGHWPFGNPGLENPAVPFYGLTVAPENDLLTVSWSHSFGTPFTYGTSNKFGQSASSETLNVTVSADLQTSVSIGDDDVVTFAGSGTPSVSFDSSGWVAKWFGHGNQRDVAGKLITEALQPFADALLNVPLPQVNTFAIDHLLFPQSNAMSFSGGYVPGDLLMLGNVAPTGAAFAITPLQAVIASGQSVQFTSSLSDVTWSRYPVGSITHDGLYTAPTVAQATPVTISAKAPGGDITTAIVVVVPAPITTASPFLTVMPNEKAFTIEATVLDNAGPPNWSITPSDGSCGTIDQNGLYTPPDPLPAGVTAATVTASLSGSSATTLLCLVNAPFVYSITPPFAALAAGASQQFQASTAKSKNPPVQWSTLPATTGTISADGLYTAPAAIEQPTPVVAMAEDTSGLGVIGLALVMLMPTSS